MRHIGFWLLATSFAAVAGCGDEKKRPIGGTCGGDAECESGLCLYGACLDPAGDEDRDGLTNGLEGALGSNPFNSDSDYDGISDADELNGTEPVDTDGDGKYDIVESMTEDADGDCLPDQLDPDDNSNATQADLQAWASVLCGTTGVCKDFPGGITVTCGANGTIICDYSGIAQYQAEETTCDGLDNNCDGTTDEGHADRDGNGVADCVDTDLDGDGEPNGTDNCPDVANPGQEDADGDGIGDACDPAGAPVLSGFLPTTPANVLSVVASGTSEPLAKITVYSGAMCEISRGSGTASATGTWTADITLEVGANTFSLRATNPAGLSSPCVASTLVFEVDQSPPAAPRVLGIAAVSWNDGVATFAVSGETELGASVRVFTDNACANPISESASAASGLFTVTTNEVAVTVENLYVQAVDVVGNAGACGLAGRAYGTITAVVTNSDDKPIGEVAVQFHYPDGKPASEVVYTDATGQATITGFAGFGITVDTSVRGTDFDWSSALGVNPGQVVPFVRRLGGIAVEDFSYTLSLTFPELPVGVDSWIKVLAPCGSDWLQVQAGGTSGLLSFPSNCFLGETFDIALVAYGVGSGMDHYLVKTGVPAPTTSRESITFEGSWSSTGWFENSVTLTTSSVPSAFSFLHDVSSRGVVLDSNSYDYRTDAFAAPQTPGEGSTRVPPIPGATARWSIQLPFVAANGTGRVGIAGDQTTLPFDLSFDVDTDFLPRIYAVRTELQPVDPTQGGTRRPLALFWHAERGLSRADALATSFYFSTWQIGSVNWNIVARPNEMQNLVVPSFGANFPGASLMATSWWDGGNITVYDVVDIDGFDALLEVCAPGQDCDLGDVEMSFSTCCSSSREDN